ncbi:MAG: hypothetical protein EZS28_019718 [Streblomastix strix]|uniref:Uncharacterized protein n=1 Tax=Streblomastix strix TaxID=222440 RepID=A0A5J4VQ24_9EUKA|nr:MAG: hypothetical protein EZS28_019718 [Streblomastix strix]
MIQSGLNQNIVIERLQLSQSPESPLIGFIRTQGAEAGLVMQDVRVQGYLETTPYNTMLEPEYLFSIEGFVHLQDVIFEHIYLRTGTILQVVGLRRTADDSRMEWLEKQSIGFYSCTFDDIASNETTLITLHEKKVRFEILSSEFRNVGVRARNMIYLGWGVEEPDETFDVLRKHGLIFINNLNKVSNESIVLAKIDINGLYVWNCHSAVGSAITVTRLSLDLSESIVEDP